MSCSLCSKTLLNELQTKRIDLLTLQQWCAKWYLAPHCYRTIIPLNFPAKTTEIFTHESISPKERKKLDRKYYEDNPKISEYYDKRHSTFFKNWSKLRQLEEFIELAQTNEDYQKYKIKISVFVKAIVPQAIELGFRKYIENYVIQDKQVKEIQREFG